MHLLLKILSGMANSVDPDQQSDLGLHCLHMSFFQILWCSKFWTFTLSILFFYQLTIPEDLGELFKVRIGFKDDQELSWYEDYSGAPSWFIEEVV